MKVTKRPKEPLRAEKTIKATKKRSSSSKDPFANHADKYNRTASITSNVMTKKWIRDTYNRINQQMDAVLGVTTEGKHIHLTEGVENAVNKILFQGVQRSWKQAKRMRLGSSGLQEKHVVALFVK